MDVSGLLQTLERAGGYAAIVGIMLLIGLYIVRAAILQQERREAEMRERHKSEIEREVRNARDHREDKVMLVQVVQENSRAQTALVGAVEKLTDTQERTNARLISVDQHLAAWTNELRHTDESK